MFFYEVALTGLNLLPLTFESEQKVAEFCEVEVETKSGKKRGFVLREVARPEFETKAITAVFSTLTPHQKTLAKFIARYYSCQLGVSLALFTTGEQNLPKTEFKQKFEKTPVLSEKQKNAEAFLLAHTPALLFGDTGSGKSEIYISLIAKALNEGKQAVFLMPEISLTPQMTARLREYFGDSVGVWHSHVSKPAKAKLLKQLATGEVRLVAGARSALFLPLPNLSLVIVDEEHDESYKSGTSPFYNARDLAVLLGDRHKEIRVVLGSATPSVTSLYKFKTHRLNGTFFASQKEFLFDKTPTSVSKMVISHISKTLEQKKQAVVFLPTRANFRYLICGVCGKSVECPHCSVGMSLHKNEGVLKCHYCGFFTRPSSECVACGEEVLQARKMGTSEVVEQLKRHFPDARIAKFDRDEITTQKKLESVLEAFNSRTIDILVGTQMLSKGHDYHSVNLAVILGLDDMLSYADFRAREKCLSLAMQVAGRAGRSGEARVLLQTLSEEFFRRFVENYDAFYEDEVRFREPLYPPFSRLMRILINDKKEENCAKKLNAVLGEFAKTGVEVVGSGKAVVEKVAGTFRYYVLLRAKEPAVLLRCGEIALKNGCKPDIDPLNFG